MINNIKSDLLINFLSPNIGEHFHLLKISIWPPNLNHLSQWHSMTQIIKIPYWIQPFVIRSKQKNSRRNFLSHLSGLKERMSINYFAKNSIRVGLDQATIFRALNWIRYWNMSQGLVFHTINYDIYIPFNLAADAKL